MDDPDRRFCCAGKQHLIFGRRFPGLDQFYNGMKKLKLLTLSIQDASVLRATITISDSMMPGNYICSVGITDKNNPEAAIVSTWAFEVEQRLIGRCLFPRT